MIVTLIGIKEDGTTGMDISFKDRYKNAYTAKDCMNREGTAINDALKGHLSRYSYILIKDYAHEYQLMGSHEGRSIGQFINPYYTKKDDKK